MPDTTNPLETALAKHKVTATVVDLDHHRIGGGLAVETDYIVQVEPTNDASSDETFETFRISKTYSSFRTLASQLKKIAETAAKKGNQDWDSLSPDVKHAIKFTESVSYLVTTQRTQYLGKVSYQYVKSLSQQRSQTINDVLESFLQNFPANKKDEPVMKEIGAAIEIFLLTDHVEEEGVDASGASGGFGFGKLFTPSKGAPIGDSGEEQPAMQAKSESGLTSPVVPVTRKHRKSVVLRVQDEAELQEDGSKANLFLDDDRNQTTLLPSYSAPVPVVRSGGTKVGDIVENNPYVFLLITVAALMVLRSASYTSVTIDTDIFLLIVFAFFCLGYHLPRPSRIGVDTSARVVTPVVTFQKQKVERRTSSALLRRSMMASPKTGEDMQKAWEEAELIEEEEEIKPEIKSPMEVFPEGAELGSKFNCWSQPKCTDFKVRGPDYLQDKKKVPSDDFIFPCRGVDLFLTDLAPENVGRISGVMGGMLREKPSFLLNFRLPWGVYVLYFEIPEILLPFLWKCYEPDFDDSKLPSLDDMSPGYRTVARFLMGDDDCKNSRLKIVPVVVQGPWVVKSVVGGKPAIIGNKMPVNYIYQPREGDKAEYLEADFDIVASSAARGILSVVRGYTNILTLDLGFVVEGKEADELPEQMLTGTRAHGVDPLTAPPLPPMKDYLSEISVGTEESSTSQPASP